MTKLLGRFQQELTTQTIFKGMNQFIPQNMEIMFIQSIIRIINKQGICIVFFNVVPYEYMHEKLENLKNNMKRAESTSNFVKSPVFNYEATHKDEHNGSATKEGNNFTKGKESFYKSTSMWKSIYRH